MLTSYTNLVGCLQQLKANRFVTGNGKVTNY